MDKSMQGTVTGNHIRLDEPLGLEEGTQVEIVVRAVNCAQPDKQARLESLFGSCRESSEALDDFLIENEKQRRLNRREIEQ